MDASPDTPIDGLGLHPRAYNALSQAGLRTVGEVLALHEEELMSVRNFGLRSLREVSDAFGERGIPTPPWWGEVLRRSPFGSWTHPSITDIANRPGSRP